MPTSDFRSSELGTRFNLHLKIILRDLRFKIRKFNFDARIKSIRGRYEISTRVEKLASTRVEKRLDAIIILQTKDYAR